MAKGELIKSTTLCKLMKEFMDNSDSNVFLADGFPRS